MAAPRNLRAHYLYGQKRGITSVCTAHPVVIEAALLQAKADGGVALIEATCNQVNQDGGYTGMTPEGFRGFVEAIAGKTGFDIGNLVLGGDHLGPNPWTHLGAEEALTRAEVMIRAYVHAGFTKIHLDTSMPCAGESGPMSDAVVAERAARLARVSESAWADSGRAERPRYIIGTEVPVPGGALEALDHLQVTTDEAALRTFSVHEKAFSRLGLEDAFSRVIGLVVQPGVEFGNAEVVVYDRTKATRLCKALDALPGLVFEAHSTDYQPQSALSELVEDGFSILKVGPGLTFAFREAIYGLDQIASVMDDIPDWETVQATMERLMCAEPKYWQNYYSGTEYEQRLQRHFSYSDRIRYYWSEIEAKEAVRKLVARLGNRRIPETLVSQYLGGLYPQVASGELVPTAPRLIIANVQSVLKNYSKACGPK